MVTTLKLQHLLSIRRVQRPSKLRGATMQPTAAAADAECIFHQALHLAYRRFARQHPEWANRGFDERFLRGPAAKLLTDASAVGKPVRQRPTGMDLARQWDRQFGALMTNPQRVREMARLAVAASDFLGWFVSERHALLQEKA